MTTAREALAALTVLWRNRNSDTTDSLDEFRLVDSFIRGQVEQETNKIVSFQRFDVGDREYQYVLTDDGKAFSREVGFHEWFPIYLPPIPEAT